MAAQGMEARFVNDPHWQEHLWFHEYFHGETGQGLLSTKDKTIKIINTIPNTHLKQELLALLDASKEKTSGAARWRMIRQHTTFSAQDSAGPASSKRKLVENTLDVNKWREELVLTYCYPRLDVNVSKAQNHLLKSPFCVHPKTGRVCIPIDPRNADNFNPFNTPTLRVLCAQVNTYRPVMLCDTHFRCISPTGGRVRQAAPEQHGVGHQQDGHAGGAAGVREHLHGADAVLQQEGGPGQERPAGRRLC